MVKKIPAKMTDSQDENLLFLYDDAQSIYQKKKALDFTLSSVDIKATGRTTILNINYRNTQQILHFASCIAFNYLNSHIDSSLTYHKPAAGGMNGDYPNLEHFDTQDEEIARAVEWITEQNEQGIPWSEIAILSPSTHTLSNSLSSVLESKKTSPLILL
ncbi:3'-5' exonuclease [Escherichia coli]